jgi:hypothetical protein
LPIPPDIVGVPIVLGQKPDGPVGKPTVQGFDKSMLVGPIHKEHPAQMTGSFGPLELSMDKIAIGALRIDARRRGRSVTLQPTK